MQQNLCKTLSKTENTKTYPISRQPFPRQVFMLSTHYPLSDWLRRSILRHQNENHPKFEMMDGFQAYYEPFPYGAFPRAPTSDEVRKCEALCRGEIKKRYLWPTHGQMRFRQVHRSLIKSENHHCFYYNGNDPYLQFGPIKAEILSDEPKIVQFYDIISDTEIEKIKSLSRKMLQPSQLRDDLDDAHQIRQVYNSISDLPSRPVY